MGLKRKRELKEDAVPTQFCFKKCKTKSQEFSTKCADIEERDNVSVAEKSLRITQQTKSCSKCYTSEQFSRGTNNHRSSLCRRDFSEYFQMPGLNFSEKSLLHSDDRLLFPSLLPVQNHQNNTCSNVPTIIIYCHGRKINLL